MAGELSFEQPLIELQQKINELKQFSQEKDIDFSEEIVRLEERYKKLEENLYKELSASEVMQMARHAMRPTSLAYIHEILDSFIELHGDRLYGDDLAIVGGIGKVNGIPVTVVGHQKGKDTKDNIARNFGMPHPEGFRKALRLMEQANKFGRPIITFIDTPGGYPGGAAEERGQAEAIAKNLMEMAGFRVPIISIVIGEGGSGGALALGVANKVLMLEHSIYSVISPNGAASILWKDANKADEAAEAMKITARDLHELKVIDGIIPEVLGGAHRDVKEQASYMKKEILHHLTELMQQSEEEIIQGRYMKFRNIGEFMFISDEETQQS
ncbi:acetyl-CoA carboxylase carboxyl transferase subunit alpha [Longirhabdus pacifica]|uniref:acetyl-CoA carboxylase carboxyl transferase subunit alpha n=1 Tax=Longirhabdus pacifica TaxID=2305227 RepID=UPI0010086A9D|nr:acetyl-CoA carboxylase carboxyl transferase subunit alpha [Longirhabdus pacifica]